MADDVREPGASPVPEPSESTTSAATEPAAPDEPTLESLQAELEQERQARRLYEETLSSLQASRLPQPEAQQQTAPAYAQPQQAYDPMIPELGITRSQLDRVKQQLGYQSDDEAVQAGRWFNAWINEYARPLIGVVGGMSDVLDRHQAKLSVDGYKELEEEVEKEVQTMRAKGSHLPRAELAQLVRARRLPKKIAEEAAERAKTKRESASARRAEAIESTTQKPATTRGARTSLDQIKNIDNREERIKALEDLAGNSRI